MANSKINHLQSLNLQLFKNKTLVSEVPFPVSAGMVPILNNNLIITYNN